MPVPAALIHGKENRTAPAQEQEGEDPRSWWVWRVFQTYFPETRQSPRDVYKENCGTWVSVALS